jgi:hypothetical protein
VAFVAACAISSGALAQDHLSEFNRVCASYGLTPGTPGFNQCLSDQFGVLARSLPPPPPEPEPVTEPAPPPAPSEPSFLQRLAAATQELYAERAAREAAQPSHTTTVCHKDFNGDVTCRTQ